MYSEPVTKRATGIVLIALAATLWGTWPLYTRAGGPTGVGIGFLALVMMALPAPFVFRRAAFADRGAVIALVIIGLADAANMVLYFSALERAHRGGGDLPLPGAHPGRARCAVAVG
jgi:drug/metabolite transporter (DMT)-like permease